MSEFDDEHEALERELLNFFESRLGERVFAPAREAILQMVQDHLADAAAAGARTQREIGGRLDQLSAALERLEHAREETAELTRAEFARFADQAERRMEALANARLKASAVPAVIERRLARMEAYVDADAGPPRTPPAAEEIPGDGPDGGWPAPRPRGSWRAVIASPVVVRLLAATQLVSLVAIVILVTLLLAARSAPSPVRSETASAPAAEMAETALERGWRAVRTGELCGGAGECEFEEAWQSAGQPQRRAIAVAAIAAASRAPDNCTAFVPPTTGAWDAATSTSVDRVAACFGEAPRSLGGTWPNDARLREEAVWALERIGGA
ncbi:MAG TPA: hypothetical protein VGB49_02965 [Caulobacteraceae bacterium]